MKLRGATKFLLVCWLVAACLVLPAYAWWQSARTDLSRVVAECQAQQGPSGEKVQAREYGGSAVRTVAIEELIRQPRRYKPVGTTVAVDLPGIGVVDFPAMSDERLATVVKQYVGSVCEDIWRLRQLHDAGYTLTGVQQAIIARQASTSERELWLLFGAAGGVGLALLGTIPWGWYFLLARLREVADAIRGRGQR
jgi:hypothetical protein